MKNEQQSKSNSHQIRVLHITWSGHLAGMLHDIVEEQRNDNTIYSKVIFCCGLNGVYAQNLIRLGLDVTSLNMHSKYGLLSNIKSAFRLYSILKDDHFNIVHMQEVLLPFIISVLKFTNPSSKFIIHNRGDIHSRNKSPYSNKNGLKSFFSTLKKRVYPFFINRFADKVIVNSDYTAVETRRAGVQGQLITSIHNAIKMSEIEGYHTNSAVNRREILNEIGISEPIYIFGIASRLVKWKRHELLFKAFQKCTIPSKILIVMGEGEELGNLKILAKSLGISENVYFLGFRNDCKKIISALDVAVLPSYQEPFGIAALESVLMQIPTFVMNDGGGLTEFIINDSNGFICNNYNDLCDKIELFTSGKIFLNHSIDFDEFRHTYSIANYNSQIKSIYNELLTIASY